MRTHVLHARGVAAAVALGALLAACTGEAPESASGTTSTAGGRPSPFPSTPAGSPSATPDAASPSPIEASTAPPAADDGDVAPSTPAPAAGGDAPADAAPPPPAAPAPAPPAASPAAEPVTVVVTFGGWDGSRVEVGGYVDGHVEAGGTCLLTLARDGSSVTGTAPAVPDATTTQCGVSIGGDRLSPGVWRATLSYTSPNASGSAADVTIEVP